jgi:hypothetical protein
LVIGCSKILAIDSVIEIAVVEEQSLIHRLFCVVSHC